ncbi:MAG: sigma-70 family RNA polymerase sigma factor [Gammaproteobacteria bacterium]|nr:sigma-70 family RNA polymerase sigma factor [Gammaproteobacteria bacterium]
MSVKDPATGIPEGLNRDTFPRFAEPHRQELKLHCYRMLGSLQDAEDAVQETFVKAWNALDEFEGRALFKNWLYRIATNACLNALTSRSRRRRLLPEQLTEPAGGMPTGQPSIEMPWLEPYPDSELEAIVDPAMGPERRYEMREAVRLAFVAAIQTLPPRQRAALILSDVIGWSIPEIVSLLGGSPASVNSVLQRARETMRSSYGLDAHGKSKDDADQRALLNRYVQAWESTDLDGFVKLLKEDATYSMPPWRFWYSGRDAIQSFFGTVWKSYRGFRLLPVGANAQPAFALYSRANEPGWWNAHSLQVLSLQGESITALTMFVKPLTVTVFPAFRLPLVLQD